MRKQINITIRILVIALILGISSGSAFALAIGDNIPSSEVKMKNVDGKMMTFNDVKGDKGTLVIFSCNHCPWVIAWEDRIVELGNRYMTQGIGVIQVNSNDPSKKAGDGFEGMVKRYDEKNFKFPYVVDETSDVARSFGAERTPEFFLFDKMGKLVYHGTIDDNAQEPEKVDKKYLQNALDALISGAKIDVSETKSLGCSIKFR